MAEAALARPPLPATEADLRVHVRLSRRAAERLVLGVALLVFLIHAANYLFFFVDDEGIPFVFARNLLHGKGLIYNSFEGRAEGYSDFLHVIVSAAWLWGCEALGLGRLAPFFVGKAVSFAAGVGTVLASGHVMRRLNSTPAGLAAGFAFLIMFPPLAMWSCSSLEMANVTLLVTLALLALLQGTRRWDGVAAVACSLLVLERIDGFVFAGALLLPALVTASRERRGDLLVRVVGPLVVVLAVYHGWRRWYFGDWLTCPLAAKVLYKLLRTRDIVTRTPPAPYLVAFLRGYGVLPGTVGALVVVLAALRVPRARPLLATAALMVGYVSVVGDWMAGFRFLLPAAPVVAALVAISVSSVGRRSIAWSVTTVLAIWLCTVAVTKATAYDHLEYRDSWWRHPSLDERLYFGQYLRLYEDLATIIGPGSLVAYNQAGFVPYMLDVENLDDLGICSRFVARLPTTDVIFTEVGRYSPLTGKPALRTAHSYVLYRNPEFIVEPLDNVRSANNGAIPDKVLRSHYELLFTDPHAQAVVYRRIAPPGDFQTNPHTFLENLATPSRLQRAFDGEDVAAGDRLRRLAFLADGALDRTFAGHVSYDVVFAKTDVPVYELDLADGWSRTNVQMVISLRNSAGRPVLRDERTLAAGTTTHLTLPIPGGVGASEMELTLASADGGPARVILHDVRVQGQSQELAAHVAQLPFPAPK